MNRSLQRRSRPKLDVIENTRVRGDLIRLLRRVRWFQSRAQIAKVVLATAGACALAFSGYALAAEFAVTLGPEGPQPVTVTVNWGDTVAFTNADSETHGIQIPRATVTSPDIPPGGTFLQAFNQKQGTFGYTQTGRRRRTGQVIVEVRGQLTLSTAPAKVVFGKSVSLTGNSPYPGTSVVITYRRVGSQEESELLSTTAAEDGSYSASFSPQFGGRLRANAAAGQLRSSLVTVAVAPRLTIEARPSVQKVGRPILVTGRIAPADAARNARLEKYNTRRKTWERLDMKPVSRAGVALFRLKAEKGRSLLRVSVDRTDLEPGYEPAASRWVAVRGQ